jgi:hypothetical protein
MRFVLATFLAAGLIVVGPSTAATPPARQIAALKRQVAALKHQVAVLKAQKAALARDLAAQKSANATLTTEKATLKTQNDTLTLERDDARAKLATAQTGTGGALSTMSAYQLADTILPTVYRVFDAQHTEWLKNTTLPYASGSMSRTVSGDGRVGYTYFFDACSQGFC